MKRKSVYKAIAVGLSVLLYCYSLPIGTQNSYIEVIKNDIANKYDNESTKVIDANDYSTVYADVDSDYSNTDMYTHSISIPSAFTYTVSDEESTQKVKVENKWTGTGDYEYCTFSLMQIKISHKELLDTGKEKTIQDECYYRIAITGCNDEVLDIKVNTAINIPSDIRRAFEESLQEVKDIENPKYKVNTIVDDGYVTAVAPNAFTGRHIKSIDLTGVKILGDSALAKCPYLPVVTIPSSVEYVGSGLLSASGLKTLSIQNSMAIVPKNFCNDTPLSEITFSSLNSILAVDENAFSNTVLAEYPFTNAKNCAIIKDNAFSGCNHLVDVSLNDNTYRLNQNVFADCTKLRSLKLGKYTEVIDRGCFSGCTSLADVTLNNVLSSIGGSAFAGCTSLVAFPDLPATLHDWVEVKGNVGYGFGDGVFASCTSLKGVCFSPSITKIPEKTFMYCSSLVTPEITGNIYEIGEYAFAKCENLQALNLDVACENVGAYAFSGCVSLQNTVSETYTHIGDYAYQGCSNIKSAVIGVTSTDLDKDRGVGIFSGCTSLSTVTLTDGFKVSIPKNMFEECTSLRTVNGVDTVQIVGEAAFNKCSAIEKIDLNEVRIFEAKAFGSCSKLKSVSDGVITASDYGVGCFLDCVELSQKVNSTANTIGNNAFKNSGITEAEIKGTEGTTILIGDSAFSGCANLKTASIEVTEKMQYKLGIGVFKDCKVLEKATYTGSTVYESMFSGCEMLNTVSLPSATVVNDSAFRDCAALKLLSGVTKFNSIGSDAFNGCSSIISIYADNDTVFSGKCTYQNCSEITNATVSTLVTGMFSGCTSLKNVNLASSIRVIPPNTFDGCSSLSNINLEDIVDFNKYCLRGTALSNNISIKANSIGVFAFANTTGMHELSVEANVIEKSAFSGSSLQTVNILANEIGISAFEGCTNLDLVNISKDDNHVLSTIGNKAFNGCSALESIKLDKDVISIGIDVFKDCNENFAIWGYRSTEPEAYANKYSIPFIDMDNPVVPSETTVVTTITEPKLTTQEVANTTTNPVTTVTEVSTTATEPVATTTEALNTVTNPVTTISEAIVTTTIPVTVSTEPITTVTKVTTTVTELQYTSTETAIQTDVVTSVTSPETQDTTGEVETDKVLGDVNSDGSITTADLVYIIKYLFRADTNINKVNADMNSDGVVNASDLMLLRQLFLK